MRDVLETKNFTNCRTWLFFSKYAHQTHFNFLSTWSNFNKLGVHVLQNNLYVRFLKSAMWHVFCFMFYIIHLTILNLKWKFLELIYNEVVYWLFLSFLCRQFKLERSSTEKLKLKHLDGVFRMFWFFGILKICGFVFMKINLILQLHSRRKISTCLAKLTLTRWINSAFLIFNFTQMK